VEDREDMMVHKIGENRRNKMDKLNANKYELEDEDFMKRGQKIHGETIKGYGKMESEKITKLTPLRKD